MNKTISDGLDVIPGMCTSGVQASGKIFGSFTGKRSRALQFVHTQATKKSQGKMRMNFAAKLCDNAKEYKAVPELVTSEKYLLQASLTEKSLPRGADRKLA